MSYLNYSKKEIKGHINKLVKKLRHKTKKFDAIAFTGISGALIAPTVAYLLEKDIIAVRKNIRDCHDDSVVVMSNYTDRRYIIIDDFIVSGKTVECMIKRIKKVGINCECVGIYLYAEYSKDYDDVPKEIVNLIK